MSQPDHARKFQGIWCRALNEPSLAALTPELIMKWAGDKGFTQPSAVARDVGIFHPTPAIVLEVAGTTACFPKTPASGDEFWHIRRKRKDEEAALWEKMEWFSLYGCLWARLAKCWLP
jgi:hypothetical protein